MKIGVFDSGLGGLVIAKAIREALPHHDMVYLGDTLHVPYGSRSREAVLQYTHRSMDFLFREANCQLIIMACNTASALTLRHLQQTYLKDHYPERRILGVVVPTLEVAIEKGHKRVGLIATERIVESAIYKSELEKLGRGIRLFQKSAPLLVPTIELNSRKWLKPLLAEYLKPLLAKNIDSLILGCTHYAYLKSMIRHEIGRDIEVISQDDIIPPKLVNYLERHPEIDKLISKKGQAAFYVTDMTEKNIKNAQAVFKSRDLKLKKVVI